MTSVYPRVSTEPGVARVTVQVAPSGANRGIVVAIDGPDYYRSSLITLLGNNAPRRYELLFEGIPAGDYEVDCTLIRDGDDRKGAPMRLHVIGKSRAE